MSRLANMEVAGFYACPPAITDLITTYIAAPNGGRVLDPCAGEGTVLVTLAERLGLDPFGIELHEGRVETARLAVLFGTHRPKAVTPDGEIVERLAQQAVGKEQLLPITAPSTGSGQAVSEPTYTLPPLTVKRGAFKFRSQFADPADALAEARQLGASTKSAWREHLDPSSAHVPLWPLTPLKIGHMNSVIAAGHLNNQVLEACTEQGRSDGDERLLITGRSYKVTHAEEYAEPLPDGRTRVTHLETESVVTDITTVDMEGQVTSYKGVELEQFLQKWITHLTGIVAQDYPPVYTFDMNGYGRLLNSLSKQRPIPSMNGKSGLLPAQKHAAAAILTRLETYSLDSCDLRFT